MSSKKHHRPSSISTSDRTIKGLLPGQPPGTDFIIEPYTSPTSKTQKFRIIFVRKPSSTDDDAQSPPPPSPCPWLWRCHSCYTIYRLSVTRRCLDCDHTFCLGEQQPTTTTGSSTAPKGGKKKRKRGGPCKAEFDYKGWKTWGSWRRTKLLNNDDNGDDDDITTTKSSSWGDEYEAAFNAGPTDSEMTPFEEKREHLFLRKRHNCFLHCDFPSECHHALFKAQQEGRPILREALALDAAAAAEEKKGKKKFTKKITVAEYKQRRTSSTRFVEDLLPSVDEADEEDNSVSPCSPTSPDPPGDLMREVSPIEREGQSEGDDELPLSPRRRSLLVATDTPADFATTAAPFSFDDENTYSNDGDDQHEAEEEKRRTKSRRKIAQLTGCEGLESFGPFRFDTSSAPSSPTSPPGGTHSNLSTLDLQAAYSEQAWFSSSSQTSEPLSPKSPERMGKRDRMLALLGRRGPPSPSSPTRSSSPGMFDMPARRHNNHPQHADATATASGEYGSSPDSSPTSSSTSSASTNTSAGSGLVMMDEDEDDIDADGDVPMRDVDDEDTDESPVTPTTTVARGDEGEEDLRALLRMRNAFMRGDMI